MIYPRLKLKSEVFSSVLDGSSIGEFRIDNEDERTANRLNAKLKEKQDNNALTKKYENISKKTEERLKKEEQMKEEGIQVRQQNISDFFFVESISQCKPKKNTGGS